MPKKTPQPKAAGGPSKKAVKNSLASMGIELGTSGIPARAATPPRIPPLPQISRIDAITTPDENGQLPKSAAIFPIDRPASTAGTTTTTTVASTTGDQVGKTAGDVDALIAAKDARIAELAARNTELEKALKEKEEQIAALQAQLTSGGMAKDCASFTPHLAPASTKGEDPFPSRAVNPATIGAGLTAIPYFNHGPRRTIPSPTTGQALTPFPGRIRDIDDEDEDEFGEDDDSTPRHITRILGGVAAAAIIGGAIIGLVLFHPFTPQSTATDQTLTYISPTVTPTATPKPTLTTLGTITITPSTSPTDTGTPAPPPLADPAAQNPPAHVKTKSKTGSIQPKTVHNLAPAPPPPAPVAVFAVSGSGTADLFSSNIAVNASVNGAITLHGNVSYNGHTVGLVCPKATRAGVYTCRASGPGVSAGPHVYMFQVNGRSGTTTINAR